MEKKDITEQEYFMMLDKFQGCGEKFRTAVEGLQKIIAEIEQTTNELDQFNVESFTDEQKECIMNEAEIIGEIEELLSDIIF